MPETSATMSRWICGLNLELVFEDSSFFFLPLDRRTLCLSWLEKKDVGPCPELSVRLWLYEAVTTLSRKGDTFGLVSQNGLLLVGG